MSQVVKGEGLFALRGVTVNFGNVVALSDVDFEIRCGEVVGLVGDNGAGKSTLVKVITGFHPPSAGVMQLNGRIVAFSSPREARGAGIETVYQDLALIPGLSLWRNFFLGRELRVGRRPFRFLAARRMREITMEQVREMGLTRLRSPDEPVEILSGGERQALSISRAQYFGGCLLLLDEPTSALSVKETEKTSEAIRVARGNGLGVVIIDHNIGHVHEICDRIVILENGRVAASVNRGEMTAGQIADMVAGRHLH